MDKPATKELRLKVFEAQNWRCCYCGIKMFAGDQYECRDFYIYDLGFRKRMYRIGRKIVSRTASIEHIVERRNGGENVWDNLAGACRWCNTNRFDRSSLTWYSIVVTMKKRGLHPHFGMYQPPKHKNKLRHESATQPLYSHPIGR